MAPKQETSIIPHQPCHLTTARVGQTVAGCFHFVGHVSNEEDISAIRTIQIRCAICHTILIKRVITVLLSWMHFEELVIRRCTIRCGQLKTFNLHSNSRIQTAFQKNCKQLTWVCACCGKCGKGKLERINNTSYHQKLIHAMQ